MSNPLHPSTRDQLVTVIVCVYNGERHLAGAIDNIRQQTYQPVEIILVDDGSTDKTTEIADRYKDFIRYEFRSHMGLSAARNTGLGLASGEIITFLDVDDRWTLNWLSVLTEELCKHPNVDIAQGLTHEVRLLSGPDGDEIMETISGPNYAVLMGSAIYRRRVFDVVGLFNENLLFNDDTDWFIRAWDENIVKLRVGEAIHFYRKHDGNMTNVPGAQRSGFVRLLKERLDNHRERGSLPGQNSSGASESLPEYLGRG